MAFIATLISGEETGFESLLEVIANIDNILTLQISRFNFTLEDVSNFASNLRNAKNLQQLHLSLVKLRSDDAILILESLNLHANNKLNYLDLAINQLDDEFAEYLAEVLVNKCSNIEVNLLHNKSITDAGKLKLLRTAVCNHNITVAIESKGFEKLRTTHPDIRKAVFLICCKANSLLKCYYLLPATKIK